MILEPYEVASKTNEITALPVFIQKRAVKGVVFAFDAISTQKNCSDDHIDSGNDYLGALKGNQSRLLTAVQAKFQAQETILDLDKGHGRIEKHTVSISHDLTGIPDFPGLQTLIRVESERAMLRSSIIRRNCSPQLRCGIANGEV